MAPVATEKQDTSVQALAYNDKNQADAIVEPDLTKELIDTSGEDPVLTGKMALINEAIDEIGMTPVQWKLFFLNGFGYGADTVRN